MKRTSALIVGASGLVGGYCLRELLASEYYTNVVALVRMPIEVVHQKLDHYFVDFDNLAKFAHLIKADDVFCTLGTTIRKAGSQAAFEKVDYTYPLEVARAAVANGAKRFFIVTAIGSDSQSSVFYNRVKGRIEEAIKNLPFKSVHIFRPSILIGERQETRPGETVGIAVTRIVSPLLLGSLKKYRAIEATVVARAMILAATNTEGGLHVYESNTIQQMYDERK